MNLAKIWCLLFTLLFFHWLQLPPIVGAVNAGGHRRLVIAAGGAFGDENGMFSSSAHQQQQTIGRTRTKEVNPRHRHRVQQQSLASAHGAELKEPNGTINGTGMMPPLTTTTKTAALEARDSSGKKQQKQQQQQKNENSGRDKEKRREEFYKKVQNVQIQDEHAMELYQHWAEQAFSSLFSVVANQKLKQFQKPVHDEFGECSKRVKSVPEHAKCVSDLINGKFDGAKIMEEANQRSNRFDKYRMKKRGQFRRKFAKQQEHDAWIGSFKMMRDQPLSSSSSIQKLLPNDVYAAHRRERRQSGIVKKNFYELMNPSPHRLSPMGRLAQTLMKQVLKAKGKKEDTEVVPWQNTVERIQNSAKRRKQAKKVLESDDVQSMDQLTYRGLKKQGVVQEDLSDVMENPERLRKFLARKRQEKGREAPSIQRFMNLLRDGIKLGYAFAGKNSSDLENKTLKMVSPRFMSVTPEDDPEHNETVDFLSPSLFSMHNGGRGIENLTSLPNLLRSVGGPMGFSAQDQQMWLDFIMEASGVIEDAEKIEVELNNTVGDDPLKAIWEKHFDKERYEREIRTKDGTPLYFTKQNISDGFAESEVQKVDLFEVLQKKIDKKQIKDMNNTGYAFLSDEQLEMLYGKESPYGDRELLDHFRSLDKSQMAAYVEKDIHSLAELKSFKITRKELPVSLEPEGAEENGTALAIGAGEGGGKRRTKRQTILSPITFTPFIATFLNLNPIILSPIIFSPLILAPAVLGPVILSPWAFVPLILSPRLLSPLILSPPVFAPLVLTPLALHPVILSPGAFVPLILSPMVLTPFILSPQVFTPFVLSPFALSPFILNPAAASPIVLSPYVLSPIILSPQFLSALVLSPYALSPIIQSPLIAYSVILSPSYLS